MIRINFREYFYLYESIDQNFDQWLVDLKKNARPDESEIKTYSGHMSLERDWIERTLKSKNVENKQYMKYLIGVSTTPQSSHIEDYERAVDTLKWFIQTNRLTRAQVEADGWFNTGKRATELTREKDQILNPYSKTREKKEKKLGIAEDISPLFQSGNIKIYFSPKVTNERISKEEDAEKPEIKARHKILCKYGKDTGWCTASATGTFHAIYADRNIYIVHIDDKPAYQFMDCSKDDKDDRCQFHDASNAPVRSIPLDLALLIKEKLPKIASFYDCVINTFIKTIEDGVKNGNLDLVEKKRVPVDDYTVYIEDDTKNLGIIKYLVEKGAKISYHAVANAIKIGNLDIAKYLVEKGGEISSWAVYNAIEINNLDLVEYLVEKGAKIHDYAVTQAAIMSGNLALVEYLVKNGAKIGDNAVNDASKTGNLEIVEYLVKNGAKISNDAVIHAAKTGNLALVEYLVKNGAEISDYAVIDAAIMSGNLALVKYLVENGGKISHDAVNDASKTGNLEIVEYLVKNGAKISNDALIYAAMSGDLALVTYFIEEKGVKIDDNAIISNAIISAASNDHLHIVKYLVGKNEEKGKKINYVVFLIAIRNNILNLVKYLVEEKGFKVTDNEIEDAKTNYSGDDDMIAYLKSAMNRN